MVYIVAVHTLGMVDVSFEVETPCMQIRGSGRDDVDTPEPRLVTASLSLG